MKVPCNNSDKCFHHFFIFSSWMFKSDSKWLKVAQSDSKRLKTTQSDSKRLKETQRDSNIQSRGQGLQKDFESCFKGTYKFVMPVRKCNLQNHNACCIDLLACDFNAVTFRPHMVGLNTKSKFESILFTCVVHICINSNFQINFHTELMEKPLKFHNENIKLPYIRHIPTLPSSFLRSKT